MQSVVESRFLGISAKSLNAGERDNQKNKHARGIKYALQRTAQSLLWNKDADRQHRTCSCHRNVASDGVPVYRTIDGSDARFGNLISCGSVWSCPVCSGRITESRRADMQKAQSAWLMEGGSCSLMTLTFPHTADMPLAELLEKFGQALTHFKNSRTYKNLFGTAVAQISQAIDKGKPLKTVIHGEFPRLGTVRSLEVTHGQNGWHPHVHEVLFMEDDSIEKCHRAHEKLAAQWVESLLKCGLGDRTKLDYMLKHALDIRGGDYVSDYINKFGREPIEVQGWTIAHEVTKANSKMGKGARQIAGDFHYTPFQLLGYATDGDETAAALFVEFSRAFEGKRMNYWTNGLKDWFKIDEVEDEDLAEESAEPEAQEEFVIRLDIIQWRTVLETNARSELLAVAAEYGLQGVEQLLLELQHRPKTHRGWFLDRARPDISRFFH